MQEKEEKSAPVVGESEKENVPESTIARSEEIKAAEAPKASSSSETTKPEEQVVVCERCGTLRGAEAKVYQCQLCMMNFCVKHIDPYWHYCPSSRQS